jgi:hypothetical protein
MVLACALMTVVVVVSTVLCLMMYFDLRASRIAIREANAALRRDLDTQAATLVAQGRNIIALREALAVALIAPQGPHYPIGLEVPFKPTPEHAAEARASVLAPAKNIPGAELPPANDDDRGSGEHFAIETILPPEELAPVRAYAAERGISLEAAVDHFVGLGRPVVEAEARAYAAEHGVSFDDAWERVVEAKIARMNARIPGARTNAPPVDEEDERVTPDEPTRALPSREAVRAAVAAVAADLAAEKTQPSMDVKGLLPTTDDPPRRRTWGGWVIARFGWIVARFRWRRAVDSSAQRAAVAARYEELRSGAKVDHCKGPHCVDGSPACLCTCAGCAMCAALHWQAEHEIKE